MKRTPYCVSAFVLCSVLLPETVNGGATANERIVFVKADPTMGVQSI